MRLSTAPDRDERRAIDVLHAAFDAGVAAVDTANAYCFDDSEIGHNERLIARALKTWRGDPAAIRVATKGGLTRPHGQWVPDGRARSLIAACEASLRALDVNRIPLYQLHAPDPRVPFTTSVRALHALKRDGRIDAIGLCNVTVTQIEEARAITDVVAVQVELNLWTDAAVLGGILDYCVRHDVQLLAHRPLGGPERRSRIETDPLLLQLSAAHGATPFEIALAALRALAPVVVPVPGSTRPETATSIARASHIELTEEDRRRLAESFPACRAALRLRSGQAWVRDHPHATAPTVEAGEAVIIMGLPAAGKSTAADALVGDGYTRINRDETGGSLRGLLHVFDTVVRSGARRIVLDNTYVSRKARGAVIQAAREHGLPIRCVWLATGVDDAQVNAVSRIVSRYGRLLDPEELKKASRQDVAAFGPAVQFRYQRELEPPDLSEGFSRVDVVPFERRPDPGGVTRAVIVWCDGVLLRSRSDRRVPVSPSDVEAFEARGTVLRRYAEEGWRILGLSWLPEIAEQTMSADDAEAVFARMRELLGVDIEVEHCPHPPGPPICWCRKPLPGLGVVFVKRHHLDPSQCIYVGAGPQDPGFARKLGFQYRDAEEFFDDPLLRS
jgi:aryl-alcohol dehydrogenase-like predicted oxidoreductase/histidinol phosphatase-like enzyme/predicted kinase